MFKDTKYLTSLYIDLPPSEKGRFSDFSWGEGGGGDSVHWLVPYHLDG